MSDVWIGKADIFCQPVSSQVFMQHVSGALGLRAACGVCMVASVMTRLPDLSRSCAWMYEDEAWSWDVAFLAYLMTPGKQIYHFVQSFKTGKLRSLCICARMMTSNRNAGEAYGSTQRKVGLTNEMEGRYFGTAGELPYVHLAQIMLSDFANSLRALLARFCNNALARFEHVMWVGMWKESWMHGVGVLFLGSLVTPDN